MQDALLIVWADDIRNSFECLEQASNLALDAAIDLGRKLADAKSSLAYDSFRRLFKNQPDAIPDPLPFSLQWARKLIAIAENEAIHERRSSMPQCVSAIGMLGRLSDEAIEEGVASGQITPTTTTSEAAAFARVHRGSARRRSGGVSDDVAIDRFWQRLKQFVERTIETRPALREQVVERLERLLEACRGEAMAGGAR